ncbi:MAG TPA: hypothetical protein VI864_06970 [Candidatus Bathyarchaeia archaeon]|nr:hypothetical protein [Candidatus Bathyarchaeia archaeon]
MSLRKALWASMCAFVTLVLLQILRTLNLLASEYDILISWISTISLILLGVFIGVLISEKRGQVRWSITFLLVFAAGFFAAPLVGVGILMVADKFPFSRGIEGIIFGGSITIYLLLYMLLWFWLKKKNIFKFG